MPNASLTETEILRLIERCKKGETVAFAGLVHQYQERIYNLCRHLLAQAQNAEDAAQDSFVKAYRGLGNFTPDASFYTWLLDYTIDERTNAVVSMTEVVTPWRSEILAASLLQRHPQQWRSSRWQCDGRSSL